MEGLWDLIHPGVAGSTNWSFHTARDVDLGPLLLHVYMCVRINDAGMGDFPSTVAPALLTPVWGFHVVPGDIDPGHQCFGPQFVGVVGAWNNF